MAGVRYKRATASSGPVRPGLRLVKARRVVVGKLVVLKHGEGRRSECAWTRLAIEEHLFSGAF